MKQCFSDRLVIKLQNFCFKICGSRRYMVGQKSPFGSTENFGNEKLKIFNIYIYNYFEVRVQSNQKDNLEGAMA